MRRVAIIGMSGAGKSTLARQLSRRLAIPVVHLDALFWKPGWVESDDDEFMARQESALAGRAWVTDGNYSRTLDLRLERADTFIMLTAPRLLCLWRVISRRWKYRGRTRPDMGPDCPERIEWALITWIWTYPRRRVPDLVERITNHPRKPRFIRLKSPAEVRRFVAGLDSGAAV